MQSTEEIIEEVSCQFDEVYRKAQELLDEYNPCKIAIHECGGATCVAKDEPGQMCCIDCEYHSYDGCTIMCLGCKLSICMSAGDLEELRDKLNSLKSNVLYYFSHVGEIRMTKEEVLASLTRALKTEN